MKRLKIAVAFLVFASSVAVASAQTTNSGIAPVKQEVQNVREDIKVIRDNAAEAAKKARVELQQTTKAARQDLKAESDKLRANLQSELKTIKEDRSLTPEEAGAAAEKVREEARSALQQKAESLKEAITADREAFKTQLEAKKTEVKQKVEAEKSALQEKLKALKDERKKQTVLNVSDQLQKVNGEYLDKMTKVADNLSEVLRGISSRADKAALEGRDVSAIRADIAEAEAAITAARSFISVQAGKTYAIQVTTEANLKTDVSAARESLKTDLGIVKESVQKAREAVQKAATDLGKVPQVNQEASE